MNTETRNFIITLLAEGNPIWYVAAVVKLAPHTVYTIARTAGYPDAAKLRSAAYALRTTARAAA